MPPSLPSDASSLDLDILQALTCQEANSLATQSDLEDTSSSSTPVTVAAEKVDYTLSNFQSVQVTLTNTHEVIDEKANGPLNFTLTLNLKGRRAKLTFENVNRVQITSELPMIQHVTCIFIKCLSIDVNVAPLNTLVSYHDCCEMRNQFKLGNIFFKFNFQNEEETSPLPLFTFKFRPSLRDDNSRVDFGCRKCQMIKQMRKKSEANFRTAKINQKIRNSYGNINLWWLFSLLILISSSILLSACFHLANSEGNEKELLNSAGKLGQREQPDQGPKKDLPDRIQKEQKFEPIECDCEGIHSIVGKLASVSSAISDSFGHSSRLEQSLFFGGALKAHGKHFEKALGRVNSVCFKSLQNASCKCEWSEIEPLFYQLQDAFKVLSSSWSSGVEKFAQVLGAYWIHTDRISKQIVSICRRRGEGGDEEEEEEKEIF